MKKSISIILLCIISILSIVSFAEETGKSFKKTKEIYGIWYLEKNPSYCFDVSVIGIQLYSRDNMKTTISKTKFISYKNIKLSKDKKKILCLVDKEKYNIEFSRDKKGNILVYDKNNKLNCGILKKIISIKEYENFLSKDKSILNLVQEEENVFYEKYNQSLINEIKDVVSYDNLLTGRYFGYVLDNTVGEIGDELLIVDFKNETTIELIFRGNTKRLTNGSIKINFDEFLSGGDVMYIYTGYDEYNNRVKINFEFMCSYNRDGVKIVDVEVSGFSTYKLEDIKYLKWVILRYENGLW